MKNKKARSSLETVSYTRTPSQTKVINIPFQKRVMMIEKEADYKMKQFYHDNILQRRSTKYMKRVRKRKKLKNHIDLSFDKTEYEVQNEGEFIDDEKLERRDLSKTIETTQELKEQAIMTSSPSVVSEIYVKEADHQVVTKEFNPMRFMKMPNFTVYKQIDNFKPRIRSKIEKQKRIRHIDLANSWEGTTKNSNSIETVERNLTGDGEKGRNKFNAKKKIELCLNRLEMKLDRCNNPRTISNHSLNTKFKHLNIKSTAPGMKLYNVKRFNFEDQEQLENKAIFENLMPKIETQCAKNYGVKDINHHESVIKVKNQLVPSLKVVKTKIVIDDKLLEKRSLSRGKVKFIPVSSKNKNNETMQFDGIERNDTEYERGSQNTNIWGNPWRIKVKLERINRTLTDLNIVSKLSSPSSLKRGESPISHTGKLTIYNDTQRWTNFDMNRTQEFKMLKVDQEINNFDNKSESSIKDYKDDVKSDDLEQSKMSNLNTSLSKDTKYTRTLFNRSVISNQMIIQAPIIYRKPYILFLNLLAL